MEILKVGFILAAVFSLGSSRAITSEESPWDTIDEEFEKLIVSEQKDESAAQNEDLGILTPSGEATSAIPETSSYDVSSESTSETVAASGHVTTLPKQTASRRKRSLLPPEPSCFSGVYKMEELFKGIVVKIPVCRDVASARDKCLGATFKTYGKRACELSHYKKMNISGVILSVATNCSCKV